MISPEIVNFGPFHLRWYGLCVALGMLAGYLLMAVRSKRYQLDASKCADIVFAGMLFGLAGARLEYVRREWATQFEGNFVQIFKIWEGGLSFQGGLILAAVAIVVMCLWRKWSVLKTADLITPALLLGHAFGRVGCFLNGCCFGKVYDGFCAVSYPFLRNSVFPIQLVESLFCLLLCGFFLLLERKNKMASCFFPLYMVLYSIGRFFIEYGRGDYADAEAMFTPAQSLFLFVTLPLGALLLVAACLMPQKGKGAAQKPGREK